MVKGKDSSGPGPDDAWKDKTTAQEIPPGAEEVPHDATAVSELPFDATSPSRPLVEEPPPRRSPLRKAPVEAEPRASAVVKRPDASRRVPRVEPEPPARPSQVRRAAERQEPARDEPQRGPTVTRDALPRVEPEVAARQSRATPGRTGVEFDSTREIRLPAEEQLERRGPDFSSTQPVPSGKEPAPDFSSTRPLAIADPPPRPDFSSTQPIAAGRSAGAAPKEETRILPLPDDATPPPSLLPTSTRSLDDATPPPSSLPDFASTRSLPLPDDATPPPRALPALDDATPPPSVLPPAARPAGAAAKGAAAKAGAFSLGAAPKSEKPPEPPVPKASAGARVGQFLAGAVGMLVLALLVWAATRDRPATPFLERAYPYGFDGMSGPRGEQAPPASLVKYRYEGEATCPGFEVCLRYSFSSPTGFAGEMQVGKQADGQWVRANDEGLPFRPNAR